MSSQELNVNACNTAVQNYIDKSDRYDADIEKWKVDSAAYQRYEARYNACMNMQDYPHTPNSNYNQYYLHYLKEFQAWEFPTKECWSTTRGIGNLNETCQQEMQGYMNIWGNSNVMPPASWWRDVGTTDSPLWIMASDYRAVPVTEKRNIPDGCSGIMKLRACKLAPDGPDIYARKKVIANHLPISDVDGGKNWAVLGRPVQPQAPGASNILCCGITFDNLTAKELSIDNITQNCQQTVSENKTVTKADGGGEIIEAKTTSGEKIDISLKEDNTMTYSIIALIIVCLLFLSSLSVTVAVFLL